MINIIINGKEFTYSNEITVFELLKELKIAEKVMAVAINMQIIKQDKWDKTFVKNGDKIEFLHFVGGG